MLKGISGSKYFNALEVSVEIGEDSGLTEDCSKEILEFSKILKIQCFQRGQYSSYSSNDYVIAAGWRWLISGVEYSKLIIFHDSLLPRYRGFAPLINALLNKEKEIGVTAIFGDEQYDRGDVIHQISLTVEYPIRIHEAIELISKKYELLAQIVIDKIVRHVLNGVAQLEFDATYSIWLDDVDYLLDWSSTGEEIVHKINTLGPPYSYAQTFLNGERIFISHAKLGAKTNLERAGIGKVLAVRDGFPLVIAAGSPFYILAAIDLNGKSILPLKKFRSRFTNDSI